MLPEDEKVFKQIEEGIYINEPLMSRGYKK